MDNSTKLKDKLCKLFPDFSDEFEDDEELSLHGVFLRFSPVAYEYLSIASRKQMKEFCEIINEGVSSGGELENAISTCFLEHASQIGVRKLIKPFLFDAAKRELR